MKLNFLVYGSGAREHAIAKKLAESNFCNKLFLYGANDGFSNIGAALDEENLIESAKKNKVDVLVVGPENPLCDGITDEFLKAGIKCIGVNKYWSQLESSKYFAKLFMQKHNIKTAKYKLVDSVTDILSVPVVLKADGLCKGKGVSVVFEREKANKILAELLAGKFGDASGQVLIEEYLLGDELSLISLWDGKHLLSFLPARDFKRKSSELDSLNTGGMGAYTPVKLSDVQLQKLKVYENSLKKALQEENANFVGFIYSGLIWHEDDFYVLEYNVRMGDPEAQALLTHMDSDLGELFYFALEKRLDEYEFRWKQGVSACIVLSAANYPEGSSVGKKITGLPDSGIYYAGVKKQGAEFFTNGGRILSVCANGERPFNSAKKIADSIHFEDKYYRRDLDENQMIF